MAARRPAARPGGQARPRRRQFPALYKLRIIATYDQLDRAGKGALLRQEHLRASQISQWRKQRDKAALEDLGREPGGQPAHVVHAGGGLWEAFGAVAAVLGYRRPEQLLRIVMRYYVGMSDFLPTRPGPEQPHPDGAAQEGPSASGGDGP